VVEHIPGDKCQFFKDLDELLEILKPYLEETLVPQPAGAEMRPEPPMEIDPENALDVELPALPADASPLRSLRPALGRLDRLLSEAVRAAQSIYGLEAAQDPYRGLYISADEAARLLRQEPAVPLLAPETASNISAATGKPAPERPNRFAWLGRWFIEQPPAAPAPELLLPAGPPPPAPDLLLPSGQTPAEIESRLPLVDDPEPDSPLAWLAQRYGLSSFDLDVLLIALAPELDLRYERLYAYLQDDVSRRRPSVDLVLNLLCESADEKASRRSHFSPGAPLVQSGLLHLTPDREDDQPPLLSHFMKLDGQVVRFLIAERTLDPRLAPFSELVEAETNADELPTDEALLALLEDAWDNSRPLRLYFQGQPGSGRRQKAGRLAAELKATMLIVDTPRALAVDRTFDWVPRLVFREAWFHNALVYLRGFDTLRSEERSAALGRFWEALVHDEGITFLEGTQPWAPVEGQPGGVITITFPRPSYAQRRALWKDLLTEASVQLKEADLDTLAGRFRLDPGQIADAFATALNLAHRRVAALPDDQRENATLNMDDLFAAARAQTGSELGGLARKIEPLNRLKDIVLPDDTCEQLIEICQRVAHGNRVLEDWGFDRKLSQGKGTAVLFAGPSGTGKTMAAEILAAELGLDLYKIDLSSVVSKYIGETEKNLERIFQAAENSNAILFFDEADALFGKRSEVRDSHDRYANIEISYLLQKMETYDGLAILATNLRQNLDDAFVRRMAFTISFPFPDEASRRLIWEGIWPKDIPRDFSAADLDDLAARFKLSGGNIKNIALAAAYLAASVNKPVSREHIMRAIYREFQKMGKAMSDTELYGAKKEPVA
jgi:AAA+ superfamily predicted ATPase